MLDVPLSMMGTGNDWKTPYIILKEESLNSDLEVSRNLKITLWSNHS